MWFPYRYFLYPEKLASDDLDLSADFALTVGLSFLRSSFGGVAGEVLRFFAED